MNREPSTRLGHASDPSQLEYPFAWEDLGTLEYDAALARQRAIQDAVIQGQTPPTVLLVEHPPVITVSRRATAASHLLASPDQLSALGITVTQTDRGGDITYHGPGQLVAYPILRLADLKLHVSSFMHMLERVVIRAVAPFGVHAGTIPGCTGVWVDQSPSPPAKLAALGVRFKQGVSMHGVAINVRTDLAHFATIVPCGLSNRSVISLQALLGPACPDLADVKRSVLDALAVEVRAAASREKSDLQHATVPSSCQANSRIDAAASASSNAESTGSGPSA